MNENVGKQQLHSLKKIFLKLLNNNNFQIDCRNNIDTCVLETIHDDLGETCYVKQFTTIFNNGTYRDFFSHNTRKKKSFKLFKEKNRFR